MHLCIDNHLHVILLRTADETSGLSSLLQAGGPVAPALGQRVELQGRGRLHAGDRLHDDRLMKSQIRGS